MLRAVGIEGGQGDLSRVRVLVIEDNANDQELLLMQLRKAKIDDHILFVDDGKKALALLSPKNDLAPRLCAVFLDLNLPGVPGLEILRSLRASPQTAQLPVIVMTGSDDPKDIEDCRRLKATSYVQKPISIQAFCVAVANVFHAPQGAMATGLVE